ncbi:MerR family DNA-binding transcriptional regulator [Patescibacteria group bacterium]|nr:MerR family DNA-binding transcriptional regulator [Patescibacteria group bacterium]
MAKISPGIHKTILAKSFVSISKAAKFLQISPDTLRNWERAGKLLPARTPGGARRYSAAELLSLKKEIRPFASTKKGLVSVSLAAKALQVSPDTLRNWDNRGLIESQRSKGGARRFTRDEIVRLQKELGVETVVPEKEIKEATQVLVEIPKSSHEVPQFTFPWLKISFSVALIIFILAAGWFFASYIDPLQSKIDETSKIAAETVKSIEALQRGVLGIQTQLVPSPTMAPSNPVTSSANPRDRIVFASATTPLTLDPLSGQVGCASCLTNASSYISILSNSDGTLTLTLDNKTADVSLNLDHTNNWPALQAFQGGIGIGTASPSQLFQLNNSSSNPVVMTSGGNIGIGITSPVNKLEVAGAQTIGAGYAGVHTAPTNGLLVQGNVGIGISVPSFRLDVAGGARFGCGDTSWNSGPTTDCSDVAEVYQSDGSVGVGEIVALNKQANIVTRSGIAYQQGMIGVRSASPGLLVGGQTILGGGSNLTGNKIPVALAGRVPVKVSDENGPVEIGDYLTSSSIPGVAMKATRVGSVIGQALEQLDFFTGEPVVSKDTHLVDMKVKFGTILVFINVSYADPKNFLAALTMDDQGNLIVPKIKTSAIVLDPSVAVASTTLNMDASGQLALNTDPDYASVGPSLASNTSNFVDLAGTIASLEDRVKSLESRVKEQYAEIARLSAPATGNTVSGNVGIGVTVAPASLSQYLLDESASKQASRSADQEASRSAEPIDILKLTPPDVLLATSSASFSEVKVTGTLSSDKLFTAQDSKISGELRVFGKAMLAATTVAGDLTVDGTLSLNGNSVNVIGSPVCSEVNKDCGILYIQNSPLAYQVNFFNGLVAIDKAGNLRAQTVTVAAFKVVANRISGSGKITAGTKSVDIENAQVEDNARILITPNSETNLVLAVTNKAAGKKFTVSVAQPATEDITFDWFLINESPD